MGFGGPNPGIWGESVRKALNPSDEQDAHDHEVGSEQALLDQAELRELERTGLYGEAPQASEPHVERTPESTGRKAFGFARAFVLWFALFCVILFVAYATVLPGLLDLVTGSN
jgi:hypothetical protein